MRCTKKGFTLIGFVIVVIIIGIFAAITTPMMRRAAAQAKKSEAFTAIGAIRTAEKLYYMKYSSYAKVTNFSINNPLSQYLAPGSLTGKYYTDTSYQVKPDADGGEFYISCSLPENAGENNTQFIVAL